MKKSFILFLLVLSCTKLEKPKSSFRVDLIDKSTRVQDNLFNHVNGIWSKNTKIPDDRVRWGSFDELREKTSQNLLDIMKKSSIDKNIDPKSDEGKAVLLYNLYTDTLERNKQGVKPVLPYIESVNKIKSINQIEDLLIDFYPKGSFALFYYRVTADSKDSNLNILKMYPGVLGIERDYYLKEDENSKKILGEYKKHVKRMFHLIGFSEAESIEESSRVIEFEKKIASIRLDKVSRRDASKTYNPLQLEELYEYLPLINWKKIFNSVGLKNINLLVLSDLNYFKSINQILQTVSIDDIKSYLKWTIIDGSASSLSMDVDRANWEFYGKVLNGSVSQRALEKRAVQAVNSSLGDALGKVYVSDKFTQEAKDIMLELIENLKIAYTKRIENLKWMDSITKINAINKLRKMKVKVGFPDKWEDYSKLQLIKDENNSNYFEARINIAEYNFFDNLSDFEKPVDKSQWLLTPQTVNAGYVPIFNEIIFPAAFLQPPFFDMYADPAVNYGAIGSVIGHEILHGFDDSGADFDEVGNLRNWWTEKDLERFNKLGEKLANQFSEIEVLPGNFINGKFTLGENIGDLGGLRAAYDAYKIYKKNNKTPDSIYGYTPEQLFFISFANNFRTKIREEAQKNYLRIDPHSPGYYRVNQSVRNMDEFHEAFNTTSEDSMFLSKEKRVYIW
ncbi:MAG: endothelin-converting protein [Flavobacteriaceae bacterium]|nr:endothelin-converting protein [Flavobacteriaceae bacterium]